MIYLDLNTSNRPRSKGTGSLQRQYQNSSLKQSKLGANIAVSSTNSPGRTNSPGHRPNGVSDLAPSLFFLLICLHINTSNRPRSTSTDFIFQRCHKTRISTYHLASFLNTHKFAGPTAQRRVTHPNDFNILLSNFALTNSFARNCNEQAERARPVVAQAT